MSATSAKPFRLGGERVGGRRGGGRAGAAGGGDCSEATFFLLSRRAGTVPKIRPRIEQTLNRLLTSERPFQKEYEQKIGLE